MPILHFPLVPNLRLGNALCLAKLLLGHERLYCGSHVIPLWWAVPTLQPQEENGGQCPPYNLELAGPAKPQGQGGRFVEAGPKGLDAGQGVPAHMHPVGE